jgi:hypothetical protein
MNSRIAAGRQEGWRPQSYAAAPLPRAPPFEPVGGVIVDNQVRKWHQNRASSLRSGRMIGILRNV